MSTNARINLEAALIAWTTVDEPVGAAHERLKLRRLVALTFDPNDCTNVPEGKFAIASCGLHVGDAVFFVVAMTATRRH